MDHSVWIYIGIGAAALILLLTVIHLLRGSARRRAMRQKVDDKLREEALDKRLIGRPASKAGAAAASPVPFDVRYDLDQRKRQSRDAQHAVMVQITEHSELSTRKYMFHISDRLTFGSQSPPCDIAARGAGNGGCEIFRVDSSLYVKNYGKTDRVILKRKRLQTAVGLDAVKLENHDILTIGECTYEINIVKN